MAQTNLLALTFLVVIAVRAGSALSEQSWYCHRLVPRVITHAVTPCTYPCLIVSSHVHPHIVVQNEQDGTPCRLANGLYHGEQFGTCRSSICTPDLSHKVLKRKKRFICLYTIGRILQLRRERKRLKSKIGQLQEELDRNRYRGGDNADESGLDDTGTGSLGVGLAGTNDREDFGAGHGGATGSGPRNFVFPGSGRGNSVPNTMGSSGFEGSSSGLRGAGTAAVMPNRNRYSGFDGNGAFGNAEDMSPGQVRIRGSESRGMPVEGSTGFDENDIEAS